MLVLSRQRGETVMIGDEIEVSVIDVRGEKVRLGINAPRNVAVHRKEVYEAIRQQNIGSTNLRAGDLPANPPPVTERIDVSTKARQAPHLLNIFTPWKDPVSGVESYLLKQRVAPLQQSFAGGIPSFSRDGRYLWFYCAFPPAGDADRGRTLGVVDLEDQQIRHFPETQFDKTSPRVDPATGECHWRSNQLTHRRGPKANDAAVRVESPAEFPTPESKGLKKLWPAASKLARSDVSGRLIVDETDAGAADRRVVFHNGDTKREVVIVSHLPPCPHGEQYDAAAYPHFCLDDRYVCYTTTVDHRADVAIVPTEALLAATA